jgi:uncharacterized protein YcfL
VRRVLHSAAIAALCAAVLSGCTPTIRVDNKSWGLRAVNERVRKKGDLLEVQVDIRNVSIMKLDFEYCVIWFDKDKFALTNTGTRWESATLEAGEVKPVTQLAPGPEARNVRIILKQAEAFGTIR